jgi:hypothetical protein
MNNYSKKNTALKLDEQFSKKNTALKLDEKLFKEKYCNKIR